MVFSKINSFLFHNFSKKPTINDYRIKELIDINYISNNKDFKNICNSNVKLCLISLLDGRHNEESMLSFNKYFDVFEDYANKVDNHNIEYAWVNATCQYNFIKQFDVDINNLPIIFGYLPTQNKYTLMFTSFEYDNIDDFVNSILGGKISLHNYKPESMYLSNSIQCSSLIENKETTTNNINKDLVKQKIEL